MHGKSWSIIFRVHWKSCNKPYQALNYILLRVTKAISFNFLSIYWDKYVFVGKKKFYPEAWYQQMKVISQGEVKRHWTPWYYHISVGRKNLISSTSHFQLFQTIFTNNCLLVPNTNCINDGNTNGEDKYIWQHLHLDRVIHLSRHVCLMEGVEQEALSQKTIKMMIKPWT